MSEVAIPLARPAVGDAEAAAVARVLATGRLTRGPELVRFEAALAARCQRAHAVAVSSGTVALELALWVLGVGAGDEVIVPAFGFPAAATAAVRLGAMPVIADVDRRTWNLDVADAAAALTDRTRVIVAIDQLGLVTHAPAITRLARDAGVRLVADSACSLGGVDEAGVVGAGYGDLAVLSFHPRKVVTTGEGGAVLCDDATWAGDVRALRNLGQVEAGQFARCGTNARLSELAAVVGCVQLGRLDALLAERRLLVDGYRERLAPLLESGRLSLQEVPVAAMPTHQTFAIVVHEPHERASVRARLAAAGIESGPASYGLSRLEVFPGCPRPTPVADMLHERALALPLYPGMRSRALDRVIDALAEALA